MEKRIMTFPAKLDFMVICSGRFFPLLLHSDLRRRYCRFARLNPGEKKNGEMIDEPLALTGGQRFLPVLAASVPYVDLPGERLHHSLRDCLYFFDWQPRRSVRQIVYVSPLCSDFENSQLTISRVATKELPDANGTWLSQQPPVRPESAFLKKHLCSQTG